MSKKFKVLAAVICAAACVAVSTGLLVTGLADNTPAKTTYNNLQEFSNKQGYQNWYYMTVNGDGELRYMIFDMDIGRWNARDFYAFIEVGQAHPGNNTETLIVFESDRDGVIDIDAKYTRCPTEYSGDGVFVYAALNDLEDSGSYLFQRVIGAEERDTVSETYKGLNVKKGDRVYFALNININNSFDNTKLDITVNYV